MRRGVEQEAIVLAGKVARQVGPLRRSQRTEGQVSSLGVGTERWKT